MKVHIFWFALLVFFSSCVFRNKAPELKEISISPVVNKENSNVSISSNDNFLIINTKIYMPANWTVPILHGDTLDCTSFHYLLTVNGKSIPIHSQFLKYSPIDMKFVNKQFEFIDSMVSLKKKNYLTQIRLPLFLFTGIKAGQAQIDIEIFQDIYYSKKSVDSIFNNSLSYRKKDIFVKYRYFLKIPNIYQTTITCKGIELYDSKGKDFSFINEGNADIYWKIEYPLNYKYWNSDSEKNTKIYSKNDTVNIFYYTPSDKLRISVWDYDMLSRDDFLGDWTGTFEQIKTTVGKAKEFSSKELKFMRFVGNNIGKIN